MMTKTTQKLSQKLKTLNESELYESVNIIADFWLNSHHNANEEQDPIEVSSIWAALGDSFHHRKMYKQAINCYKDAIQSIPGDSDDDYPLHLSNMIRFKLSNSCFQLKEYSISKNHLIAIPIVNRGIEVWNLLAKIHHELGEHREVVWCCKNIVKLEPMAVEATLKLLNLGYQEESFMKLAGDDMEVYMQSVYAQRNFKYDEAIRLLNQLSAKYPRMERVWSELAVSYMRAGDHMSSMMAFEKAKFADFLCIDYLDKYAGLLKGQSNIVGLSKLVTQTSDFAKDRPETWVILARYAEAKGQIDKAIKSVDHAISLDPKHAEAHFVKGKPMDALRHFKKAHKLYPDIYTFEALVEVCVSMDKVREGLAVAKEMSNLLPTHPRALACIGMVLFQSGDLQKAKTAFQRAITTDPNSIESINGIATILASEQNIKAAIQHLEKYLPYHSTDWMHSKLADAYLAAKDYQNALHHYYLASSINPQNERAKEGAIQVEKELRGESDEMEDDEDDLTQEDAYEFEEESIQA